MRLADERNATLHAALARHNVKERLDARFPEGDFQPAKRLYIVLHNIDGAQLRSPEAQAVPQNKHGQSYSNTGAQLVKRLLLRVKRPTPASGVGYVEVRYWHGK